MSDIPIIEPILKQVLYLYSFQSPIIKDGVNFMDCFHSSCEAPQAMGLVTNLTLSREKMRSSINNSSPLNEILPCFDEYLPYLWQLLDSLDRQAPVRLDTPLRFVWKGCISNLPECHSYNQVIFELIMVLHSKGILLANLANQIVLGDPGSVNTGAKYYRDASAIMNFLSSNLIPRWQVAIDPALKPPECSSEFCKFLSDYFAACSHQLVVGKALQASSQPPKLMTSLCLNVVRSLEFSIDFVYRNCTFDLPRTDSQMIIHLAVQRDFFYSLVYYYQAEDYYSKTETGISIALAAVAQTKLNERPKKEKIFDPLVPGLPKLSQQTSTLRDAVGALTDKIQAVRHKAESDNRMIYFKSIPRDISDLPELPPPTTLSLPTAPYEQPVSEVVIFTFDPKRQKTVFNTIASFFSK